MLDSLSMQHAASSVETRELAIARTLLSLLEGSLANDVRCAADVAEQLAEHLRKMGGSDA